VKVKKLVGFAIPVMILLSSCGVENKTSKETKTEVNEKGNQKVRVSEEEYAEYVLDLGTEFTKAYETFIPTVKNKQSSKKVLDELKRVDKVLTKFDSIDPPNKYEDIQKNIKKSTSSYRTAFSIVRDLYSQDKVNDKEISREVLEKMKPYLQDGDGYWTTVYNELKTEITMTKGGYLDSEDFKNTKTENVIDYEKMKKDIVDGTELVGNWGIIRKDKFITTFVLKDGNPKTFEMYTEDDYPSKRNIIEGTWEYDRESVMLKLHITKQVTNWVFVSHKKRNIFYMVQNYNENFLQLYNGGPETTTRNVKHK